MDALSVPDAALRDEAATELVRVWVAEEALHCTMKIGLYADQEAEAWGIVLADLAQNIADALSASGLGSRADLFAAVVDRFNEETANPSAGRGGEFGARPS